MTSIWISQHFHSNYGTTTTTRPDEALARSVTISLREGPTNYEISRIYLLFKCGTLWGKSLWRKFPFLLPPKKLSFEVAPSEDIKITFRLFGGRCASLKIPNERFEFEWIHALYSTPARRAGFTQIQWSCSTDNSVIAAV